MPRLCRAELKIKEIHSACICFSRSTIRSCSNNQKKVSLEQVWLSSKIDFLHISEV